MIKTDWEEAEMLTSKQIRLDILSDEAKKELIDFYEFLILKHGKVTPVDKSKKQAFFQAVKKHSFKLPGGYKFNREEIHER